MVITKPEVSVLTSFHRTVMRIRAWRFALFRSYADVNPVGAIGGRPHGELSNRRSFLSRPLSLCRRRPWFQCGFGLLTSHHRVQAELNSFESRVGDPHRSRQDPKGPIEL